MVKLAAINLFVMIIILMSTTMMSLHNQLLTLTSQHLNHFSIMAKQLRRG